MTTLTAARPRIVRRAARGRARAPQLAIAAHAALQGELFDGLAGGRQSATRLRHLRESMDAIDALFHESVIARGAAAFAEFLAFVCRFSRYSAFNAMLIETQRPGAVCVASRAQWESAGRRVKPGAIEARS